MILCAIRSGDKPPRESQRIFFLSRELPHLPFGDGLLQKTE